MLRSGRFWLGLVGSILFIGLFLYRVDIHEMTRALASANYLFVIPGVLLYFLALWFRTLRWQFILRPMGYLPLRGLWPVMAVGYMANNLLPIRLGELVRAYYLGERLRVSRVSTLGTILVERVFDGLALLFLAMAVSVFIPIAGLLKGLGERTGINWLALTLGLSLPFFGVALLLVVVASFPAGVRKVVHRLLRVLPAPVRRRIEDMFWRFLDGLAVLRSPRRLVLIYLVSVPVWVAEAAMFFVIAFGFRIDAAFPHWGYLAATMVLTTAIANLGTSAPSTGGGVGPFEFFAQATLVILGVGAATASAFAITVHLALLAPVTLLGLFYLWTQNISLPRLARQSQLRERPADPP